MKLKNNKKAKKDQAIESLVAKALGFLQDEVIWSWTDLGQRLDTDDNSLIGNVIHRLKRNGVFRRLEPYEPGVCYYEWSAEHLYKMRKNYEKD